MNESMKTLLKKFMSRKFVIGAVLVIIGVVLVALGEVDTGKQIIVIGGVSYLGMEGIADIASRIVVMLNDTVVEEQEEQEE